MTSTADPLADELERLRRQYRTYRARYRIPPLAEVEALEANIRRRQARVNHLLGEAARLQRQAAVLSAEIGGYRKGLVALLDDFVSKVTRAHAEHWSPTPVGGFRLWWIRDGHVHGARTSWDRPSKEAVCIYDLDDDVPHVNGPCRTTGYGCGIYATKSVRRLFDIHRDSLDDEFVAGVVAMSGKVVEHRLGYRALRAEVVAVVVSLAGRRFRTADAEAVAALFGDPRGVDVTDGRWEPAEPDLAANAAWLETQKERLDPWT